MAKQNYQKELIKYIKGITEEKNHKKALLKVFDKNTISFLMQLAFWTDKGFLKDGFIYKTYDQWQAEIGLGKKAVKRIWTQLDSLKIIEVINKRVNGHPKLHYRIIKENLEQFLYDNVMVPTIEPRDPKMTKGSSLKCSFGHAKMTKGSNTYTENTSKDVFKNKLESKDSNYTRSNERENLEVFFKEPAIDKIYKFHLKQRENLINLCASENIEVDKSFLHTEHRSVKSKICINKVTKESKSLAEIIHDALEKDSIDNIVTAMKNYTLYAVSHSKKEDLYWYNVPWKNLGEFLHTGKYKKFIDLAKLEKKNTSGFKPVTTEYNSADPWDKSKDPWKYKGFYTDDLEAAWKDHNSVFCEDIKWWDERNDFNTTCFIRAERLLIAIEWKNKSAEVNPQILDELKEIWNKYKPIYLEGKLPH